MVSLYLEHRRGETLEIGCRTEHGTGIGSGSSIICWNQVGTHIVDSMLEPDPDPEPSFAKRIRMQRQNRSVLNPTQLHPYPWF